MTVALHPTDILNTHPRVESQSGRAVEDTNLPDAQPFRVSHSRSGVGEPNLPQPNLNATASLSPAAAPNLPDAHGNCVSHGTSGVGDQATETALSTTESHEVNGGLGSDPPAPPNQGAQSQMCYGGAGESGEVR